MSRRKSHQSVIQFEGLTSTEYAHHVGPNSIHRHTIHARRTRSSSSSSSSSRVVRTRGSLKNFRMLQVIDKGKTGHQTGRDSGSQQPQPAVGGGGRKREEATGSSEIARTFFDHRVSAQRSSDVVAVSICHHSASCGGSGGGSSNALQGGRRERGGGEGSLGCRRSCGRAVAQRNTQARAQAPPAPYRLSWSVALLKFYPTMYLIVSSRGARSLPHKHQHHAPRSTQAITPTQAAQRTTTHLASRARD
jgi:hypothetical protein